MKQNLRKLGLAILAGGTAAGAADIISAIGGRAGKGGDGVAAFLLQYMASGLPGSDGVPGRRPDGGRWADGPFRPDHYHGGAVRAGCPAPAGVVEKAPGLRACVYGALLYVAMFYLIVPHSLAPQWKTPKKAFGPISSAAMSYGFFVGVPIASVARYFLGTQSEVQIFRPFVRRKAHSYGERRVQAA